MKQWRTIIMSDLHLGSRQSQTDKILKFLDENESETLILNGDIIGTIEANKDKKDPELKKALMLEAWDILSNIKSHTSDWITISKKWSKKSLIEVLL